MRKQQRAVAVMLAGVEDEGHKESMLSQLDHEVEIDVKAVHFFIS
jgi:hypothetical protein